MTVNEAEFSINGDTVTTDRGYTATNSQTLQLTLARDPSPALAVTFSVYDSTDDTSPLASADAPTLTFTGSGLSYELLDAVNDTAELEMPSEGFHSYIVRCSVTMPAGAQTYERLVSIESTATGIPIRKSVPGESVEFVSRGISDMLNAYAEQLAAFSGSVIAARASLLTGALNATVTVEDTEQIIGGFVLDPSLFDVDEVSIYYKAQMQLSTTAFDGSIECRLYDMGDGTGAYEPTLVSTLILEVADADTVQIIQKELKTDIAPADNNNRIFTTERAYELRILHTASEGTGIAQITWIGLEIT